ncbi:MAG TPA: DUF1579 domain-containing protein [bacterium]|nr:DUF1579 domain-containing protein [bacterium]
MQAPAPKPQHDWLRQWVGEWHIESNAGGFKMTGTEIIRPLGKLWIIGEGNDDRGSENGQSRITLGYDPAKGRFVGSWVGAMMDMQWVYDGELEGNTLTLHCEGPDFDGSGRIARYKDVFELVDLDHRVLHAWTENKDGQWTEFMTAQYRRVQ